jgi:hypothetical protein
VTEVQTSAGLTNTANMQRMPGTLMIFTNFTNPKVKSFRLVNPWGPINGLKYYVNAQPT